MSLTPTQYYEKIEANSTKLDELLADANALPEAKDLSFITALAEHIKEGYIGADTDGNPVTGSLVPAKVYHATHESFSVDKSGVSYIANFVFRLPDFVPDMILVRTQVSCVTRTIYNVLYADYILQYGTDCTLTGAEGSGKYYNYGVGKSNYDSSVRAASAFSKFPHQSLTAGGTITISIDTLTTNTTTALLGEMYAIKF